MKSQKGITLVSLIVYIIAMLIVVAIISVVTSYFYKNINISNESINNMTQFTRFNNYFSEDINKASNKVLEYKTADDISYIALTNGNQYTYLKENKSIYQNNVKICSNIEKCNFGMQIKNGKTVIVVEFQANGENEITMEYSIQN